MNFEIITPDNLSGGDFYISLTLKKYSRYDMVGGLSLVETIDPGVFLEW